MHINRCRRGQITLFVIIGLVALLVIGTVIYMVARPPPEERARIRAAKNIEEATHFAAQQCVDLLAENSVFLFGYVGGSRVDPDPWPDYYVFDEFYRIPYWYFKGQDRTLTKERVASEVLALYVDQRLLGCTDFAGNFPQHDIRPSVPQTTVEFGREDVIFSTNWPIQVALGGGLVDIEPGHKTKVSGKLGAMLDIAYEIVRREATNDLLIHWDYLTEITDKGDFDVTAYTEGDETIVYRIVDLENKLLANQEPVVLQFANKVKTVEP